MRKKFNTAEPCIKTKNNNQQLLRNKFKTEIEIRSEGLKPNVELYYKDFGSDGGEKCQAHDFLFPQFFGHFVIGVW